MHDPRWFSDLFSLSGVNRFMRSMIMFHVKFIDSWNHFRWKVYGNFTKELWEKFSQISQRSNGNSFMRHWKTKRKILSTEESLESIGFQRYNHHNIVYSTWKFILDHELAVVVRRLEPSFENHRSGEKSEHRGACIWRNLCRAMKCFQRDIKI